MDWFFPSLFAAPVEAQASLMDDLASATTTPSSSAVPPSPLIPPDPLEAQRTVTDILRHYSQPCGAPPPWSRYARPYEKQRVWVPPTVRNLWWYVAFFATKGTSLPPLSISPIVLISMARCGSNKRYCRTSRVGPPKKILGYRDDNALLFHAKSRRIHPSDRPIPPPHRHESRRLDSCSFRRTHNSCHVSSKEARS
jgi:hypothetical protein